MRSQKTRPILPTVSAPDSVITTKPILIARHSFKNIAASPICRPGERGVAHGTDQFVDGAAICDKSSGNIGRVLSFTGSGDSPRHSFLSLLRHRVSSTKN